MVTSEVLVSNNDLCGSKGETNEKEYVTFTITKQPAAFGCTAEEATQDAPVTSVPGQVVFTVKLDLVTPAGANELTKSDTVLLEAMQLEDAGDVQLGPQDAPRTIA